MNQDKYVFAQLTAFLNRTQFNNFVRKYDGNRYVKQFTCWNQLLAMMFGQLSNRESLRDLIVAFEAHRAKQYHLGLGRNPIAKATLAYANQNPQHRSTTLQRCVQSIMNQMLIIYSTGLMTLLRNYIGYT